MENEEKVKRLIESGANLTGAIISGTVGGFIAGLPGIVGGALLGTSINEVFKYIGAEMYDRKLSMGDKEFVRIGAAVTYSLDRIRKNIDNGQPPRTDNFFKNTNPGERSTAEEILEGTLIKAKVCYEEKKIPFIGNIYGNLPFYSFVDSKMAYQIINLAEKLTYRQLCIIAMIKKIQNYQLSHEDYRGRNQVINVNVAFLLQEIVELMDLNLGHCIQKNNRESEVIFGLTDIAPGRLRVNPLGNTIFYLMNLEDIAESDIEEIVRLLP